MTLSFELILIHVYCCAVAQSHPNLCNTMDRSMTGLCPSPSPWACGNSSPLCQWCHPTISSSVVPFSSCLQSFPASGSFLMSQCFESGGWNIGASASASVLPMNIQDWFLLGLIGLVSLQPKELDRTLQHHSLKASIIWCSAFFMVQLSHPYMTTWKTIALTRWTFVVK